MSRKNGNSCSPKARSFPAESEDRERTLILAAQGGDAEAFRELYNAYRRRLLILIRYLVDDSDHAEDVLQTVFLKGFRGLNGFRFHSGFFTWLYRIARNECWNHRRRNGAGSVPLEAIMGRRDEIDPGLETRGLDDRVERDIFLQRALMQLPRKMREVIVLKYLEGMSYEDISRALQCPPGTVASRLSRALEELGERLRPFRRLF